MNGGGGGGYSDYNNNGINYYPKLVSAIPFTPATGRKLLFRCSKDSIDIQKKRSDVPYP